MKSAVGASLVFLRGVLDLNGTIPCSVESVQHCLGPIRLMVCCVCWPVVSCFSRHQGKSKVYPPQNIIVAIIHDKYELFWHQRIKAPIWALPVIISCTEIALHSLLWSISHRIHDVNFFFKNSINSTVFLSRFNVLSYVFLIYLLNTVKHTGNCN